jgi:hypothetical protein
LCAAWVSVSEVAAAVTWDVGGNTLAATGRVGSNNNFALELEVNNYRGLRIEPVATGNINILGGYNGNSVTAGAAYATIAGGGTNAAVNTVTDSGGTIGGGTWNTAGNGAGTTSDQPFATVCGGSRNSAKSVYSTVGGGYLNTAEGDYGTVSGGYSNWIYPTKMWGTVAGGAENLVQGHYGSIGGGWLNSVSGDYGAVPGGYNNWAGGLTSFAAGSNARADFNGCFVWSDASGGNTTCGAANRFVARAAGGVQFFSNSAATLGVTLPPGDGAFAPISDRNMKRDFVAVKPLEVLEKVARLPISSWAYKSKESPRHIGPMAQDFHAAFGVGGSDRHISTIDADGIALAAIQGLNRKVVALEAENKKLTTRLDALESQFARRADARASQLPNVSPWQFSAGALALGAGMFVSWRRRRPSGDSTTS